MPTEQREHLLMYVNDVGRECRIADATARRWISSGRFGATIKVGKRIAIRRTRFLAWIKKNEVAFREDQ